MLYYGCGVLRRIGAEAAAERTGAALSPFTAVRVERLGGKGAVQG